MDVMASPRLRWSPAWAIEPGPDAGGDETTLVLSAGADRRVAVDGLGHRDRRTVLRWAAEGWACADGERRHAEARLLDRLVEVGAVVPTVETGPPRIVADDDRLAADLATAITAGGCGDLAIVVRSGSRWPASDHGLHLGVDLSLHHTVVLGPLVAPGVSACLACLDARAARRWPVPTVPPEPAVLRHLAVAAALLDVQLGLVASGTSPLINATIAWDLETGASSRQALYKLTGCPGCGSAGGAPAGVDDGRVALPAELVS